ncbi:hypothetical protein Q3G72_033678 [Acer saccharum]|nr:hypothetical protein Q3G72_033678 [Acer saccharum]
MGKSIIKEGVIPEVSTSNVEPSSSQMQGEMVVDEVNLGKEEVTSNRVRRWSTWWRGRQPRDVLKSPSTSDPSSKRIQIGKIGDGRPKFHRFGKRGNSEKLLEVRCGKRKGEGREVIGEYGSMKSKRGDGLIQEEEFHVALMDGCQSESVFVHEHVPLMEVTSLAVSPLGVDVSNTVLSTGRSSLARRTQ